MKLSENRTRKRLAGVQASEVLARVEEPEIGFDPKVHLTAGDWKMADEYFQEIIHPTDLRFARNKDRDLLNAVSVWMSQKILDPEKFSASLESGVVADWFRQLDSTKGLNAIEHAVDFMPATRGNRYSHLAEARSIFPDQHFGLEHWRRKALLNFLQKMRLERKTKQVVKTLYVFKQFPSNLGDPDHQKVNFELTTEEWTNFLESWQAVWGTGQLEDVVPDELVNTLARIRVIDPEKFERFKQQGKLNTHFWDRAHDWLQNLRNSTDALSVFQFAFDLYLLSADEVNLDENGMLRISPKKPRLSATPKLPERDVT